jgi:hypothetical protein
MNTRSTPIDLDFAEVGMRYRTRDGDVRTIMFREYIRGARYPYRINGRGYTKEGWYYSDLKVESPEDIISLWEEGSGLEPDGAGEDPLEGISEASLDADSSPCTSTVGKEVTVGNLQIRQVCSEMADFL